MNYVFLYFQRLPARHVVGFRMFELGRLLPFQATVGMGQMDR